MSSSLAILSLKVGDLVADALGTLGTVVAFTVDGVQVAWDDRGTERLSDADLKTRGVVMVDGQ